MMDSDVSDDDHDGSKFCVDGLKIIETLKYKYDSGCRGDEDNGDY